jgi:GT2 family glycosyltransferase
MNNFIYVLIRTHKRPKALRRCLNSLCEQTNKNFSVAIISDYEKDLVENLAHEYPDIHFMFIHVRPLGYPGCNLYLNQVKNYIDSDYVIFVDDDDIVVDNTYFKTIENITNVSPYPVIISKSQFPRIIIPPDNRWGLYPQTGYIGTLNFCIRNDIYKRCNWSGDQTGDFHFIKDVFDNIDWQNEVLWYNNVTTKVGDRPRFGKGEY